MYDRQKKPAGHGSGGAMRSPVHPTLRAYLGYVGAYTFANVLLALAGALIIRL
jgi:hypothetical protein